MAIDIKQLINKSKEKTKESSSKENALGTIGSMGGSIGSIVTNSIELAGIADTSGISNKINEVNNTTFNDSDFDSLVNTWDNTQDINNVSYRDVRGKSALDMGITAASNTVSGATTGASIGGPIGAIIGGVVGLGSSLGGIITGNNKAKRKARQLNKQINEANLLQQNNLITSAQNIDDMNDYSKIGNLFKDGGEINEFNNGGTHEENPLGGIPVSRDSNGIPNMVEEGEVKFKDYVFSNRLKPDNMKDKTFADYARKYNKEAKERPNDPITKRGLDAKMNKLKEEQELIKNKENINTNVNTFDNGGYMSYARYAPVVGSTIDYIGDLFGANNPDYSSADAMAKSADSLSDASYTPITQKLSYTPFDINYATNKINAQAGATRRAIQNNSGGIKGAALTGLIASDYNTQSQLGDLSIKADEYNRANKERVATFNRATDQYNTDNKLRVESFNRENALQKIQARKQAIQMRDIEDYRTGEARSRIKTSFFDNLGALGRESYDRNLVNQLDSFGYTIDSRGNVKRKEGNNNDKKKQ